MGNVPAHWAYQTSLIGKQVAYHINLVKSIPNTWESTLTDNNVFKFKDIFRRYAAIRTGFKYRNDNIHLNNKRAHLLSNLKRML